MQCMNTLKLSRWRNLGIIAHVDAGKTTLTERLLWASGAIHRIGEVHDGAATTDFDEIEQRRGITIGAAVVRIDWTRDDIGHRLTLIDTPGHIDFAIEVERSLRVLDGAVAVFSAVDGVQPQSETVWRQAQRHRVPLLAYVNKMDRPGASFARVLAQMREKLDATPLPIGLPLGEEAAFEGWVDLVDRAVVTWDAHGNAMRRTWSDEEAPRYFAERQRLVEAAADHDDALAQLWLDEQPIDAPTLRAALRRVVIAGHGVPVLAGSAIRNKGVDTLLDAIVDYLPSPLDRPAVPAQQGEETVLLSPDPQGPLAALVFKVAHQDHGPVTYVRVYSGTLRTGDAVWCSQSARMRRIGRLAVVQANRTHDIDTACAGEIVAVLGWKDAASGDTLSDERMRFVLDTIRAQPAVLAWRLSAANAGDLIRLGQGLAALAQEDPSFRVGSDPDTGETLVWGMGELHLDVKVERLRKDWRVDVRTGSPRVACQETPARAVQGIEGKVSKQNGGNGQFARVVIDLSPRDDGEVAFVDRTRGGAVPKSFVAATERGVREALSSGPHGYPVVGVEIVLVDGETHVNDSSELAFHRAGMDAARAALALAGTVVLEPVMTLTVDTPAAHVGDVVGDVQRRLGRVVAIEDKGARADVVAHAPLSRLDGYTTALRSLTQGRASASMVFHRYEAARAA
jgi:elongation factor G